MYGETAKLVVYRNIPKDSILYRLAEICRQFDHGAYEKEVLIEEIYEEIHRLLDLATKYAFDENLWQNYLAYLLATTESPFSVLCEKTGAGEGSVNVFVKNDLEIFRKLFHYDFSKLEQALDINCFSVITDYHSIAKEERRYHKNVSDKVRVLSRDLAAAKDAEEMFAIITEFYRAYGVGKFGLNKAFHVVETEGKVDLEPVVSTENVYFSDLIGYEIQKKKIIDNTEAFLQGKKANNLLLYGDSGTGKSTSIKAILNEYYGQGLRIIEVYKHQFHALSTIIAMIKNRNYRFLIYMDDLSFEEFEIEYKYLKAVIEGGMEVKPDNVLIYATSNRRHLIKETWNDRSDLGKNGDGDLHHSDTMEEKLSLVNRFGESVYFGKPNKKEFNQIVTGLAARYPEITLTEEELCAEANKWEMSHGGISGRTAQQFINHLIGISKTE
ncbi:MAG: ATP-binding protein [Lachnospiraceae bacterium]|nr:ATP-binding protein [Lachnospiraceae bacterium]